jgi:hypothetical protein
MEVTPTYGRFAWHVDLDRADFGQQEGLTFAG